MESIIKAFSLIIIAFVLLAIVFSAGLTALDPKAGYSKAAARAGYVADGGRWVRFR